jgi:hypothetical protein
MDDALPLGAQQAPIAHHVEVPITVLTLMFCAQNEWAPDRDDGRKRPHEHAVPRWDYVHAALDDLIPAVHSQDPIIRPCGR